MTDDPRDTELERAFREGLRQAADRTEVGVPLVARAHAGARTRRRRRWGVVGAVAAVVAVAGVAAAVQCGDDPTAAADHAVTEPTRRHLSTEWRAESWHDLTVDVPADWGWGTAPLGSQRILCGGPGAMVAQTATAGSTPSRTRRGSVVPIMLSDMCLGAPFPTPEAPYVWLGADVEPAPSTSATATPRRPSRRSTRRSRSPARTPRSASTSSTRLARHRLRGRAPAPGRRSAAMPIEGLRHVHSARVCAYARDDDGFDLVYATTLDEASAQALYEGTGVGQKGAAAFCELDRRRVRAA